MVKKGCIIFLGILILIGCQAGYDFPSIQLRKLHSIGRTPPPPPPLVEPKSTSGIDGNSQLTITPSATSIATKTKLKTPEPSATSSQTFVPGSTMVSATKAYLGSTSQSESINMIYADTPGAGNHTYKIQWKTQFEGHALRCNVASDYMHRTLVTIK